MRRGLAKRSRSLGFGTCPRKPRERNILTQSTGIYVAASIRTKLGMPVPWR